MKRHVWYPLCWLLAVAHLSCTGCAAGSQTSQNAALTATDTTSLNSAGSSNASDADTQTVALSSIATNTMGIFPDEDDLTADYSDFDATITLSDSGSAVSGDAAAVSIDGGRHHHLCRRHIRPFRDAFKRTADHHRYRKSEALFR